MAPHHGIASSRVDKGQAFLVDQYAATRRDGASSSTLSAAGPGVHTLVVLATGTKNAASTSTVINLDRIDIDR